MERTGVFVILLLCLILVSGPVYAASEVESKQKINDREKLAVLDLEENYGVEKSFAKALSVILRDEIYSFGEYDVMSRADLRAVMSREATLQALGCDDNGAACLVSFGRAIGTRFMVAGSLSKLGSTYSISLRMLDTKGENAGLVKRTGASCKCSEDELIAAVQRAAAELMGSESALSKVEEDAKLALKKQKELEEASKKKAAALEAERRTAEAERKKLAAEIERLKEEKIKAADAEKKRLTAERKKKKIIEEVAAKEYFTDPTTGMEFVYVKGGCYQMGQSEKEKQLLIEERGQDKYDKYYKDELPRHEVCVDGFYIGKYEVTRGEYKKISGFNPSHFKKGDNYPVERVSWNDAQDFIRKLNSLSGKHYRLPTEAEWEYAARSGGKRETYSGSNLPDSVAWYNSNSGSSIHPVGTKAPNGFGIHDMSGNVWEWCADWYGKNYYSSSSRNNPQGPSSGSFRGFRGGSWDNTSRRVRAAYRNRIVPGFRFFNLGFRLVLSEGS